MALNDVLKSKAELRKFDEVADDLCPLCGMHSETVDHLFFQCSFSRSCLPLLQSWLGVRCKLDKLRKLDSRKWFLCKSMKGVVIAIIACLSYHVWKSHNEVVWLGFVRKIELVAEHVKLDVQARLKALAIDVNLAD